MIFISSDVIAFRGDSIDDNIESSGLQPVKTGVDCEEPKSEIMEAGIALLTDSGAGYLLLSSLGSCNEDDNIESSGLEPVKTEVDCEEPKNASERISDLVLTCLGGMLISDSGKSIGSNAFLF